MESGIKRLVRCYALGQYILDGDFRDAVIDAIVKQMLAVNPYRPNLCEYVTLIYAQTGNNDALRRLAINTLAFAEAQIRLTDDETKDFPREALLHIIHAQKMAMQNPRRGRDDLFSGITCHYHTHENGKCYKVRYAL